MSPVAKAGANVEPAVAVAHSAPRRQQVLRQFEPGVQDQAVQWNFIGNAQQMPQPQGLYYTTAGAPVGATSYTASTIR